MLDFEEIYKTYGKAVYLYIMSLSKNDVLSEELMQETMFRAMQNISSYREEAKMCTWLCQIAKNTYFEWFN